VFIIELTYTADLAEIDAHMGAHMKFLRKHYASGRFVFSGRKVPRDGGIIVATGSDREEVEAIAREDPFHQHGLVELRIVEFRASQCAADLPERLDESRSQRL
jgi:uncharacterized protein YciI